MCGAGCQKCVLCRQPVRRRAESSCIELGEWWLRGRCWRVVAAFAAAAGSCGRALPRKLSYLDAWNSLKLELQANSILRYQRYIVYEFNLFLILWNWLRKWCGKMKIKLYSFRNCLVQCVVMQMGRREKSTKLLLCFSTRFEFDQGWCRRRNNRTIARSTINDRT